MESVKVDLVNCYGIKKLQHTFDFSKKGAFAIYAPNGVMKSSLAQTFLDASNKVKSVDRIFSTRATVRTITDETGAELEGERVLVVLSYNDQFGTTEKTSTLLVDPKLREEHSQLLLAIHAAKDALLKAVQQQATSKMNFEKEIASAFTSGDDFETALNRIDKELREQKEVLFADVKYDKIFDEKVVKGLNTKDLKSAVDEYVRRYNELLAASTYFKKGTFDYYNAGQIAESLAKNGFFDAKHTVNLKADGGDVEITTQQQLEKLIADEKEKILQDKALRKTFDAVETQLQKNAELREFCKYVQENEALLSRLNNLDKFKEDILKSYLKAHEGLYVDFMTKLEAAKKRRAEIEAEARAQRTQWEEVIEIFNDRFSVPFKLELKNREAVMLGYQPTVDLGFKYEDGAESVEINRVDLLKALSTGEKKALYVLNVIFEIQRRMKDKQETLIVVDDLADSFDYQNKYAIIQYLKDTNEDGLFKQIIMTHNFDFFRTLSGRFVGYSHCLMASKGKTEIDLIPAKGINNPFVNDWKDNFFSDAKKKIASISFLRNLVEYTTGKNDPNYLKLTSLLHWKADTAAITVANLDAIYTSICGVAGTSPDPAKLVCALIAEEAQNCVNAGASLQLENKIVLAIGIRLAAEKFMVLKINDNAFVASIQAHQTYALTQKFKQMFPAEGATIKLLDQVSLMTPENIHLNSFMYEPIIDMPDDSLRKLFARVAALN